MEHEETQHQVERLARPPAQIDRVPLEVVNPQGFLLLLGFRRADHARGEIEAKHLAGPPAAKRAGPIALATAQIEHAQAGDGLAERQDRRAGGEIGKTVRRLTHPVRRLRVKEALGGLVRVARADALLRHGLLLHHVRRGPGPRQRGG